MSQLPVNPLQAIITAAAKTPTVTGATARYSQRMNGVCDDTVILADVSSSMGEWAGAKRKIEHVREALESVWPQIKTPHLIAFASHPQELASPRELPQPSGGTALHLALDMSLPYAQRKTLVISDGRPDNAEEAIKAAERISGIIDVIYCGPDDDVEAISFMRRLASIGCGHVHTHTWKTPFQLVVRNVLALPDPGK